MIALAFRGVKKDSLLKAVVVADLHFYNVGAPNLVRSLDINDADFTTFELWQLVGVEDRDFLDSLVPMKVKHRIQKRNERFLPVLIPENLHESDVVFYICKLHLMDLLRWILETAESGFKIKPFFFFF